MRETEFDVSLRPEDGHMQFRLPLPPGAPADHAFHAAADGQMGEVLRVYREWQLCGDDEWLRRLWPAVKKALEYAWVEWDKDRDGLLEGVHHNTLDIEFHGPETMCGSMYLAALRAGEAMARYLGDEPAADEYRRVFERGRATRTSACSTASTTSRCCRRGARRPTSSARAASATRCSASGTRACTAWATCSTATTCAAPWPAVFRHNFRDDFYGHHNPHRVFALNDDRGLLICTWPRGGRPRRSLTYAFECMIGFEYQVGAHLIYEGYLREGLAVCKAVRDRHDGRRRNPYNEFECGSHYARAMANYSYLLGALRLPLLGARAHPLARPGHMPG